MSSRAVPYTGGDVNKSGDLRKMFDISTDAPSKPARPPSSSSQPNSGSAARSGPMPRNLSGPIQLQPTGLITSGPLTGERVKRRSGQLDKAASFGVGKAAYGTAVTTLTAADDSGKRGVLGFLNKYPDAELRGAIDGQYVKVTGVVTCGSIPLESSYQRVSRCVYVSSELCEYRGWGGKPANPKHRSFSWGSRYSEKHVADFYISDFQSGLRALVKAGYGAKISIFVKPTTVVDMTKDNQELSPNFLRWLSDRSLSTDDRIMRLKEGYIKEGSTVSVMGIVKRHDNVLMIIPPAEPVSTGCQWLHCLLPRYIENLIVRCDDNENADVVPV